MEGEEGETVEFYKIRLMEKERIISDFDAKLKKIEFRHSRDLKEAKMSEERASNLLKEEKIKSDKFSRQARENQEQNNLLQLRLTELKEDKDREVAEVRLQYNKIKEEIRSYERILPTHAFLQDCALSIDQLPTYEDIFFNLKEKVANVEQLNQKFDQYKAKKEEEVATLRQNQELLKDKKLEIERNFQEMLPKTIEYEQQVGDLKTTIETLQAELNSLKNQLEVQKSLNDELEENIKQYDFKIEQISQAFTSEVHNKEEEIKAYYTEEVDRYQEELKSVTSRLEIKDSMYLSQLAILEENNAILKTRLQEQHQSHEEQLQEVKEEITRLKDEEEKLRNTITDLSKENRLKEAQIREAKFQREEWEEKTRILQLKVKEMTVEHEQRKKEEAAHSHKKIQEAKQKYNELEKAYDHLKDQLANLQEEKDCLNEEILQVRSEAQTKRLQPNESQPKQLEIPSQLEVPMQLEDYYEKCRRFSGDFNKSNISEQELQYLSVEKEELVRERARTLSVMQENEEFKKEISSLQAGNKELSMENATLRAQLSEAVAKVQALELERSAWESETKKIEQQTEALRREKQKVVVDNISLKQKIVLLNKAIYENEEKVTGSQTRFNLQQAKIDSLEKENQLLTQELKRDKEILKPLKEELKQVKEELASRIEKQEQERKEYTSTIQVLKGDKQRLQVEISSREKDHKATLAALSSAQEREDKSKLQSSQLQKDFNTLLSNQQQLQKQLQEQAKELQLKQKQITRLQEQNREKDRENEMINSSLERQRRERTMRTVPSLQSLGGADQEAQEQTFQDIYAIVTQKQGEIHLLQREVSDLKEEIEAVKTTASARAQSLEAEQNYYIQTIIEMKMKVAESEMRASEHEHRYNQLRKKTSQGNLT